MSKTVSTFELTLNSRPHDQTLTSWLYGELRLAILEGRLGPGRDFRPPETSPASTGSREEQLSAVLERLQSEGYVSCRVGLGTWVNRIAAPAPTRQITSTPPAYIRHVISEFNRPKPFVDLPFTKGGRPFRVGNPAVDEFPSEVWGVFQQAAHATSGRG